MYVGHAAIALALKSRYPGVPILPLTLACYGPDVLEVALMIPTPREGMAAYTHSIPALVIGALIASAIHALFAHRRADAFALFAGWMLHWPADFFTGLKPIMGLETLVGLDLYHLPFADFALEASFVIVGCALYARAYAPQRRQRRIVVALACALLLLQGAMLWTITRLETAPWRPSLAIVRRADHPGSGMRAPRTRDTRMPLALLTVTPTAIAAMDGNGADGVVTLVCLTCGQDKFFTRDVPAAMSCDQCGGTVFRTFATLTEPDEAAIDALEAQARSMAYGDSSPETTRDDVRDLDLL